MDFEAVAAQLRKPEGDFGRKIAANMNISNEFMNRLVIEKLAATAGDNILEIGMGDGFFVKEIVSKNDTIKYTGADFSELMIEEATINNKYFLENGQIKFIKAEAANLPFRENTFDKIFTINTIYFWQNAETELAEITRVLKTGGKLLLAVRPKHVMEKYPFTKFGFRMYSKNELINLLEENNFKVTEIIEKKEPEQEINGNKFQPESLILVAKAIKK